MEMSHAIFYTYQTTGECAGKCTCNCTHQMESEDWCLLQQIEEVLNST